MKKLLLGILTLGFVFSCGANKTETAAKTETPAKLETLTVGASPVPHAELLEQVKEDLKKEGIDLKIVIFNDYVQPNMGLKDKSLDANFFQHVPYMDDFGKKNGFEMSAVGNIHIEPMAAYSKKIKSLNELKDGAEVLLPNDPTNLGRALIMLDKAGFIKLKDNTKLDSTVEDIVQNTKKIKFTTLAADQIAPRLGEVDAAIINGNYAIDSGLTTADAILVESKDSPYANIVTVLKGNEADPRVAKLVKALQSEKIKKFIEEKYKGSVIPAF